MGKHSDVDQPPGADIRSQDVDVAMTVSRDQLLGRALVQMWPLPLIGALLTTVGVRYMVTNDGVLYLLSGRALFSDAMDTQYYFIRDPGLPLFLKLSMASPGGNLLFLFMSGLMAGGAIAAVGAICFDLGRPWQRLTAGVVALTAAVYINYAGMVLQQTGIAFLLALIGLNLRWIQTSARLPLARIAILMILGVVAVYWTHLFAVLLVPVAVAVAIAVLRSGIPQAPSRRRRVAGLLLAVGIAVVPSIVYQPWADYRDTHVAAGGSLEDGTTTRTRADLERLGLLGFSEDRVGRELSLLQLPRLAAWMLAPAGAQWQGTEDIFWTQEAQALPDPQCGAIIVTPGGTEPAVISSWLPPICQPFDWSAYWSATALPSYRAGGLASVVFLGVTVWALIRRRELFLVLVVPWTWISLYALLGTGLDRYGIPIWPFKATIAGLVTLMAVTWVLRWLRTRFTTRPTAAAGALSAE